MDVVFTGGTVYLDGAWSETNVYLQDGKIALISGERISALEVIDARGLWVLPGLIDAHVHLELQVGKTVSRDDFYEGSRLAAIGGVTTIIDFLQPAVTLDGVKRAYQERQQQAKNSIVDYGFHVTLADYEDDLQKITELAEWSVKQGMPSVKIFTTYSSSGRKTTEEVTKKLLKLSKKLGYTLLVHAEDDDLVDESPGAIVCEHELRRPAAAEQVAVNKLAQLTREQDGYCYIVHTSCGSTVQMLKKDYQKLLNNKQLIIESCPQYFVLDKDVYNSNIGYRYVLTPPLRSSEEQEQLRELFADIDVIATDHCPYTEQQKKKKTLDKLPNGIEGMPWTLPALFDKFGEAVIAKMSHQAAKIHGLYPRKGSIQVGSDGDIVLFDPEISWIANPEIFSVSPYNGIPLQGKVIATWLRGQNIMDAGRVLTDKAGQFIARQSRKGEQSG